jgi:hypothetical protein
MEVKICLLMLLIGLLSAFYHAGAPADSSAASDLPAN